MNELCNEIVMMSVFVILPSCSRPSHSYKYNRMRRLGLIRGTDDLSAAGIPPVLPSWEQIFRYAIYNAKDEFKHGGMWISSC